MTTVLSYTWSCKLWGREYDCDELYTCRPEGCISKRLKTTTMLFVLRCMETGTSYAKFFLGGGKEAYLAYKTTTYCWYSWNIKSTARPGRLLQKERNNTAEMLIVNYLINIHFFQVILFFFILVMLTLPLILGVLPNVDNVSLGVTMVWLWFRGWLWWLTASLALHFGKQYWHITSKTTICGGVHVS